MLKKLLASEWMTKNIIAIDFFEPTKKAFLLLKKHHIRFLPVLEVGELVGVVTDRDLRLPESEVYWDKDVYQFGEGVKVQDVMTRNPIVLMPSDNLEAAATIMVKNKIGGFPIVHGAGSKKVVGVLTVSDVMRALIYLIQEKKL